MPTIRCHACQNTFEISGAGDYACPHCKQINRWGSLGNEKSPAKYIIKRRSGHDKGQWSLDEKTFQEWISEKKIHPMDEVYNVETGKSEYAKNMGTPIAFSTGTKNSAKQMIVIGIIVSLAIVIPISIVAVLSALFPVQKSDLQQTAPTQIQSVSQPLSPPQVSEQKEAPTAQDSKGGKVVVKFDRGKGFSVAEKVENTAPFSADVAIAKIETVKLDSGMTILEFYQSKGYDPLSWEWKAKPFLSGYLVSGYLVSTAGRPLWYVDNEGKVTWVNGTASGASKGLEQSTILAGIAFSYMFNNLSRSEAEKQQRQWIVEKGEIQTYVAEMEKLEAETNPAYKLSTQEFVKQLDVIASDTASIVEQLRQLVSRFEKQQISESAFYEKMKPIIKEIEKLNQRGEPYANVTKPELNELSEQYFILTGYFDIFTVHFNPKSIFYKKEPLNQSDVEAMKLSIETFDEDYAKYMALSKDMR